MDRPFSESGAPIEILHGIINVIGEEMKKVGVSSLQTSEGVSVEIRTSKLNHIAFPS